MAETMEATNRAQPEHALAYHIPRYVPNLVRDEWVNIGVPVFNPESGEQRLRLIEEEDEYNRVRRLHPWADEFLLRALRDELENRLESGSRNNGGASPEIPWQKILSKWDETLSNALQIAPQKGVLAGDLDHELERLYADHVAVPRRSPRPGLARGRAGIRSYCAQVFRQARIWERIEKSVRVAEFTFPGDPARLDYSTAAMARAASCTRFPSPARRRTPNRCPIMSSTLPRRRVTTRNLPPSLMWPCPAIMTATGSFWIRCAKSASSLSPWKGWPFG
jgi:hypothetical protein